MIHPADALVRASRRWAWAASCATCRFSSAISLRMSSRYSGTRPRLLLLERQNAFLDVAASAGGPDRHADHTPGFGEQIGRASCRERVGTAVEAVQGIR